MKMMLSDSGTLPQAWAAGANLDVYSLLAGMSGSSLDYGCGN